MIKTPNLILDISSQVTIQDNCGNAITNSNVTTVAGKFGNCLSMGASKYLVTTSNFDLSGTNCITICAWVKNSDTSDGQIIAESSTNFSNNNGAILFSAEPYAKMFNKGAAGWNGVTSSISVCDGNWHFVCGVTDRSQTGASQSKIYIDGKEDTSATHSTDNNTGNLSSFPLYMGSRAGSSSFFKGQIQQLRIFKKVLSLSDIKRVMLELHPLNG